MPITFHPRAGCVLECNFDGFVQPEIVKTRPVVIVSPKWLQRHRLYTVVPLSTTEPNPIEKFHHKLAKDPMPNSVETVWAKCDMLYTVSVDRLDRFKVGRGLYKTSAVSDEDLSAIKACIKYALGIE